jgi:hypothetical protein
MKQFVLVLVILFMFQSIFSQTKKEDRNEFDDANTLNNSDNLKKKYPTIEYPQGYYQGVFLLSFMGGRSIAPSGSFIRHEKRYDRNIALLTQLGTYENPIRSNLPQNQHISGYFDSKYSPGYSGQIDLEYGTFPNFGFGFTLSQFSINATRQDVIPLSGDPLKITPIPVDSVLYRGTSAMAMGTYHPLQKSVFDPYLVLRAGVVGFTGEAHSGELSNPSQINKGIQNGLGLATGAGAGMNIHLTRQFGIKVESFYNKQFLRSDSFSTRTLNIFTAQIGVVMNTTRLFDTD